MEEMEVPTEHLHEEMHHKAHESGESWVMGVALTSAILAALAAVASLMAGHHANEAMIAQLQAADQWNYYRAKGIKKALMETRLETIRALGKKPKADDAEKFKQYDEDQKDIKEKAED